MADWYYKEAHRTLGPLSPAELKGLVEAGTITTATSVRRNAQGEWMSAADVPGLLKARPHPRDPRAATREGDSTGGLIPYKNPAALTAYYLGLFSLFPFLGLFLAVPAFVLGIIGLKRRRENPVIKGSVHAWIGIVMGGLMTLIWTVMWVGTIAALVFAK